MPIQQLLKEQSFDPDDINLLSSAFEEALQTLGLVDRTVPAAQLVAKLIIELAQRGERDPTRLRERLTAADRRAPERMFSAPTSERSRACSCHQTYVRVVWSSR